MKRFHNRLGSLPITFLMLPILAWVWLGAREPVISVFNGFLPRQVISGKLFSEQFDRIHAGFAMDQPTIGKYLFWFSFMTGSSLPYTAAVGWLSNRRKASGRIAFAVSVAILWFFLTCMLSWPLLLLIQYVCSLGFTPMRICGLLYAAEAGFLVTGFLYWAIRKPQPLVTLRHSCRKCGYDLTGNLSGICPECGCEIANAGGHPG